MFTKTVRHGLLLDFYGPLLTTHQQEVLGAYLSDDLSLGEIAAETGVSRAAVHDLVRRSVAALEAYESKLGLVAKFVSDQRRLRQLLQEIDGVLADSEDDGAARGAMLAQVRNYLRTAVENGELPLE